MSIKKTFMMHSIRIDAVPVASAQTFAVTLNTIQTAIRRPE